MWPRSPAARLLSHASWGRYLAASCEKCNLRLAGCSWGGAKISCERWPADYILTETCSQRNDPQKVISFSSLLCIYRIIKQFRRTFAQVTSSRITCCKVDYSNLLNILLSPAKPLLTPNWCDWRLRPWAICPVTSLTHKLFTVTLKGSQDEMKVYWRRFLHSGY